MVPRSHESSALRAFGVAAGAFAILVQLLFSIWSIVAAAAPADATADLSVICTHDPAAATDNNGGPPAPHPHGQCDACACPQSTKLLAPLPTAPILVVLRPRSHSLDIRPLVVAPQLRFSAPYASRAPPVSA